MIHHIHRSQIRSYLQEHGLSELVINQDIPLAMHGNEVEWKFELHCYHMSFRPIESCFVISISALETLMEGAGIVAPEGVIHLSECDS